MESDSEYTYETAEEEEEEERIVEDVYLLLPTQAAQFKCRLPWRR